jgi:hypothetical protein
MKDGQWPLAFGRWPLGAGTDLQPLIWTDFADTAKRLNKAGIDLIRVNPWPKAFANDQ